MGHEVRESDVTADNLIVVGGDSRMLGNTNDEI